MNEFPLPSSGPVRPDHERPWAMQVVIRRDRQNPADHLQVCAAAARAVVLLLDDPRAQEFGEWHVAVQHWRAGWIRKVTRRAENKRWDDVHQLPGVTATAGVAAVRALVPASVEGLPPQVKKLQVRGTQFPQDLSVAEAGTTNQVAVRQLLIMLTPGLELSTGKAAAQVGHAAQLAYERMPAKAQAAWREHGFPLRVQRGVAEVWEQHSADSANMDNQETVSVMDAGLTEVSGPTETARAWWY